MRGGSETGEALRRAAKRAAIHLVQAVIESLKAVEAVIDEIAGIVEDDEDGGVTTRHKIDVE